MPYYASPSNNPKIHSQRSTIVPYLHIRKEKCPPPSSKRQKSACLPQTQKTRAPDRARTGSGLRTGWTCSARAAVPLVSRVEPRASGANPEQTAAQTARSASTTKENLPDTLYSCNTPPIWPPPTADCCATRLPRARHLAATRCLQAQRRPRRRVAA